MIFVIISLTNSIMNEAEEELLFFETFSHDNSEVGSSFTVTEHSVSPT